MAADFFIDKRLCMVFSKGVGELTLKDVSWHMDELASHPDFEPMFGQLIDFRDVSTTPLTGEDIRKLAQREIFHPHSKRAFVTPTDLQFGLARMFSMYRENRGEIGIQIFRDMREALDWLNLAAAPDIRMFPRLYTAEVS